MRRGGRTRATRSLRWRRRWPATADDADVLAPSCVVKAPGDLPAQFPVGPCPPTGSGPGAAGPGLVGWGRTRRRAVDHRRTHHLRDLRSGQGGGARPRLHRPARLSPAAGHCRRNRRRADGSAAQGPRQHRSGRRSLSTRDGGASTLRRGQGTTHGAAQRPTPTPSSPSAASGMCAPSPSASTPACGISAIPETDWTRSLLDGRRRRRGGDLRPFQDEPDAAPVRLIVRRVKPTPGSQLALFSHLQLSRLHHRPRRTLELEADHRRHAEIGTPSETSSTASGSTISPQAASPPTAPGWRCR